MCRWRAPGNEKDGRASEADAPGPAGDLGGIIGGLDVRRRFFLPLGAVELEDGLHFSGQLSAVSCQLKKTRRPMPVGPGLACAPAGHSPSGQERLVARDRTV